MIVAHQIAMCDQEAPRSRKLEIDAADLTYEQTIDTYMLYLERAYRALRGTPRLPLPIERPLSEQERRFHKRTGKH